MTNRNPADSADGTPYELWRRFQQEFGLVRVIVLPPGTEVPPVTGMLALQPSIREGFTSPGPGDFLPPGVWAPRVQYMPATVDRPGHEPYELTRPLDAEEIARGIAFLNEQLTGAAVQDVGTDETGPMIVVEPRFDPNLADKLARLAEALRNDPSLLELLGGSPPPEPDGGSEPD